MCGCSVLYASEPVPAGIRKVDLGHKYLISVCCPWKSSIYSWPNGKMPLPEPFPSLTDKKKCNSREAVEGTLTWCGWSRTEATPEREKKSSSAVDEKSSTRKLQMDSFHKTPHCLFGLKGTVIWYNEKPSRTAKYWILCVWYCLTVKQNKCQTEIAGLDTTAPHTPLFQHFLKWQNHFPECDVLHYKEVSHY